MSIKAFGEIGVHIHHRQAGAAMMHHSTWLENNARLKAGWHAIVDIHLGQGLHTLHANVKELKYQVGEYPHTDILSIEKNRQLHMPAALHAQRTLNVSRKHNGGL